MRWESAATAIAVLRRTVTLVRSAAESECLPYCEPR